MKQSVQSIINERIEKAERGSWNTLENAGAVFLPAAGYRFGTSVHYDGSEGNYWSASYASADYAYRVCFDYADFDPSFSSGRCAGLSVRLVCSFQ